MKKVTMMIVVAIMAAIITPAFAGIGDPIMENVYSWYKPFLKGFNMNEEYDGEPTFEDSCMYLYDSTAYVAFQYSELSIIELEGMMRNELIDKGVHNPKVTVYEIGDNVIHTIIDTDQNISFIFEGIKEIENKRFHKIEFITWWH